MFMLNDMPEQVSGELLDLLVQCRTETIGHHRHWGFVRGNIRSVLPGRRIVGTAVTVALPGHDSGVLSHALSLLREGDILCIDRLGDTHNACWGGGTTLAAKLTGAAGVVIDGPSTGSSRFDEFDFPAWTSGTSPVTCQMYGNGGALNVPVCVGGAAILPGYAILADDSGVVALPPEDVRYLAEMGIERQNNYPKVYERLRAGEKQADIIGMTKKITEGFAAQQRK